MASRIYDIITIGGGLGGSSLATAMAQHGAGVLVLEREPKFRGAEAAHISLLAAPVARAVPDAR
jgi:flavin-dependent dehydrogenase